MPATRISRFGRAIGGCLYGFKNNLKSRDINLEVIDGAHVKQAVLCINNTKITFVPLYLRGSNWLEEFNIVKIFFEESHIINPVIIGDLNIRVGNIQQDINDLYKEVFKAGKEENQRM